MTLDISQFIANSVRTQSKIHHLDINVKAVKVDEIPSSVKKLITDDYGEKYLEDSDYVAFFWGPVNKDNIDKLFNVVDKALGKSANKLTDKDFKKINMNSADDQSSDEDVEDTEEIETDDEDDDEVKDTVEEKPEIPTSYFFLKITSK